jgi:hypothetical protein
MTKVSTEITEVRSQFLRRRQFIHRDHIILTNNDIIETSPYDMLPDTVMREETTTLPHMFFLGYIPV